MAGNALRRNARRVTPGASQRFVAATERLDSGTPVVSVLGEVDPGYDELFDIYPTLGAAVDGNGNGDGHG